MDKKNVRKKKKLKFSDKINFQVQWRRNNNLNISYQNVKINGFFKRSINGGKLF